MHIGGISEIPTNNISYSMNILSSELSQMHATNLIFDSKNGSIYISGIDQTNGDLSGISSGQISFIASTLNGSNQYIQFDDAPSIFTSNTAGSIFINAYNGITVVKILQVVIMINYYFIIIQIQ